MRALSILAFSVFFAASVVCFAADESLTITTYYPSPYGLYNQLQAKSLGVGDNNNNGAIDTGDVPTTSGDAWIKGNVGIGTAAPGYKLDVNGEINTRSQYRFNNWYNLINGSGTNLNFQTYSGYDMNFNGHNGSAATTYMTIKGGGNVGIGTAAPRSRLDVGSGSGQEVLRINGGNSGNSSGSAVYFDNAGLAHSAIGNYSAIFGGAYNNALTLYTSGANTIVPNGSVGIGTVSPGARLDVQGAIMATDVYLTNPVYPPARWASQVLLPSYVPIGRSYGASCGQACQSIGLRCMCGFMLDQSFSSTGVNVLRAMVSCAEFPGNYGPNYDFQCLCAS